MLNSIIFLLIGAFIGWNLPQPIWAKNLQEKILKIYKDKINKNE